MAQKDLPKPELDLPKPELDLPLPEKELPAPPEKKSKLSKIGLILFGIIIGIFIFGTGAFLLLQNNASKTSVSPTPTQAVDETANWKTYIDEQGNYSLKYPADYKLHTNEVHIFETNNYSYQKNHIELDWKKAGVIPFITVDYESSALNLSDYINSSETKCIYMNSKTEENIKIAKQDAKLYKNTPCGLVGGTVAYVKNNSTIYTIALNGNNFDENFLNNFLSNFKFTDQASQQNTLTKSSPTPTTKAKFIPTESPLSGMKFITSDYDMYFQVPNDFVYNNSSTSNFISLLQNQNGQLAQRLAVDITTTNQDLEDFVNSQNYDQITFSSPTAHEQVTVNDYPAIAVTKQFSEKDVCGSGSTSLMKRTVALVIKGKGVIYSFIVNDSCYTVSKDWFSQIFPTIRIKQ